MKQESEYTQWLLEHLKKGDTVYTILRKVSKVGNKRRMSFKIQSGDYILDITYHISKILGYKEKDHSLIVNGSGMDMGFHVVSKLSLELFNDEYALGHYYL